MESQCPLSKQHFIYSSRSQTLYTCSFRKLFHIVARCLGTSLRVYQVNYSRGSASSKGLTRGGQRHWRPQKKRQRQKHAHYWQQFTRAQLQAIDSRENLDANQSNYSYISTLTRIPRITCACTSGVSGYIKRVE